MELIEAPPHLHLARLCKQTYLIDVGIINIIQHTFVEKYFSWHKNLYI